MASSSTNAGALYLWDDTLEPKHKVFLSHSGAQKDFVEQLCVDLERCDRYPFFDKRWDSLPIGKDFPKLIFEAIKQCEVGVVVLTEEFFTRSKWPMLELVAMVKNSKLVIIPVYLGISLKQVCNSQCQERWRLIWHGWAEIDKERINIEEWDRALHTLHQVNSLKYDGGGEVGFREKIVKAVCEFVLPSSRWKVSHVQGCQRLAKVVCGWIDQAIEFKRFKTRMIGLYGVGGIGKTTICQILCNQYFTRMQGRVFHVELGTGNRLEILQGALKSLTDKSDDYVRGLNESQCEDILEREVRKHPIFLAIDNMSDDIKSIEQAKIYLKGGFAKGSIVIMTARSLDVLENAHLGIDGRNCLEMPELNKEEAKKLFLEHAIFDGKERMKVEKEIIDKCLNRCYFQKGDGKSHHYHPLALKVLGIQLGFTKYNRNKWRTLLKELDTFNLRREGEHPIFSILRKSFDILTSKDQLLFMDVAIFLPKPIGFYHFWGRRRDLSMTSFEWLSMVHGTSVDDVMERLEGLKRKSLLQKLGDGGLKSIGMHDLWREFAIMELWGRDFEGRRLANIEGEPNALEEGNLIGRYWQNMKRIWHLLEGVVSVRRMKFDHYSNIIVLKVQAKTESRGYFKLDFSELKYLKSLELILPDGDKVEVEVRGLRSLKSLLFLRLEGDQLSTAITNDVGYLTKLCCLVMTRSTVAKLPSIHRLTCLKTMHILGYSKVTTISGLSSMLNNLRVLDLSECGQILRLDSRVGELVALQELCLKYCQNLHHLPNLKKLSLLEYLDIHGCIKIKSVPGLDDLLVLKEFRASKCKEIAKLPNLQRLTQLEYLDIEGCSKIESVPGLDDLVALKKFLASNCKEIAKLPNLQRLTHLEYLDIEGCSKIESVPGLDDLFALKKILASSCKEIIKLPNLQRLTCMQHLHIKECNKIESVSGLDNLVALKKFWASNCNEIVKLPNLRKLTHLEYLDIGGWSKIESVPGLDDLVTLKKFWASKCKEIVKLPNLQKLTHLEYLDIGGCSKIESTSGLDDLVALKIFLASNCKEIVKLPNLRKLTQLEHLDINGCSKIESVLGLDDLVTLKIFLASNCKEIVKLPNLRKLTHLEYLDIKECIKIESIPGLDDLVALKKFRAFGCKEITKLPNLQRLTHLEYLDIKGCSKIESVPGLDDLVALKKFRASDCKEIVKLPNLRKLTYLEYLNIKGCNKIESVFGLDDLVALKTFLASN